LVALNPVVVDEPPDEERQVAYDVLDRCDVQVRIVERWRARQQSVGVLEGGRHKLDAPPRAPFNKGCVVGFDTGGHTQSEKGLDVVRTARELDRCALSRSSQRRKEGGPRGRIGFQLRGTVGEIAVIQEERRLEDVEARHFLKQVGCSPNGIDERVLRFSSRSVGEDGERCREVEAIETLKRAIDGRRVVGARCSGREQRGNLLPPRAGGERSQDECHAPHPGQC